MQHTMQLKRYRGYHSISIHHFCGPDDWWFEEQTQEQDFRISFGISFALTNFWAVDYYRALRIVASLVPDSRSDLPPLLPIIFFSQETRKGFYPTLWPNFTPFFWQVFQRLARSKSMKSMGISMTVAWTVVFCVNYLLLDVILDVFSDSFSHFKIFNFFPL
jgi:hypothetical protein